MKTAYTNHWGRLTVDRHAVLKRQGIHIRVFVDGEDVTERCRYAEDEPGMQVVEMLRLTPSGRPHLDEDGHVAVEVAQGHERDIRFVVVE